MILPLNGQPTLKLERLSGKKRLKRLIGSNSQKLSLIPPTHHFIDGIQMEKSISSIIWLIAICLNSQMKRLLFGFLIWSRKNKFGHFKKFMKIYVGCLSSWKDIKSKRVIGSSYICPWFHKHCLPFGHVLELVRFIQLFLVVLQRKSYQEGSKIPNLKPL